MEAPDRSERKAFLLAALHLFVLSGFAIAQPLFDLLSRAPEFFAVRGSTPWDIAAFALGVTVLPPAALVAAELLARVPGRRAREALHLLFVAALVALLALQALKRLSESSGFLLVVLAAAVGLAGAVAYARLRPARSFLAILAPAPLLFAALFLFHSPVSKLTLGAGESEAHAGVSPGRTPPIVMVVFDELPVASLLDERRRIDSRLFPSFAALARHSTWFRNTYATNGDTARAVPAVLTGKRVRKGELPILADHPDNLFTLLGRRYRLEVVEPVTRLCPAELCGERSDPFGARMRSLVSDLGVVYLHLLLPEDLAARLPSVTEGWRDFRETDVGRGEAEPADARPVDKRRFRTRLLNEAFRGDRALEFERFLVSIERGGREPALYFLHSLLPHRPWSYLPSGKQYGNAAFVAGRTARGVWADDEWLIAHALQRHLLQLAFADRLLGRLLQRLRATGLYDDALVVVTADHGMSFLPNQPLRGATAANLAQIAPVPLLVKAPHQRRARVVERSVETVDVLPAIAALLDVRLPWATDGRSALDEGTDRNALPVSLAGDKTIGVAMSALERRKYALLARKLALVGSAGDPLALFRIGPHRALFGKSVDAFRVTGSDGLRADVDDEEEEWLASVDLDSGFVPAHVTGALSGDGARPGLPLAIALNGRVAALARSFDGGDDVRFEAIVPESAFRAGENELDVFVVTRGAPAALERVGP